MPSSERWQRGDHDRERLAQALLEGRVAGPVTSHDRRNVLMKIDRLVTGEEEAVPALIPEREGEHSREPRERCGAPT